MDTAPSEAQGGGQLLEQIIAFTQNRLISCLPYMNLAILKMPVQLHTGMTGCATDGSTIHWNSDHLLRTCVQDDRLLARTWLHMILHCVFLHPFAAGRLQTQLWDACCDIAVEQVIRSLNLAELASLEDARQEAWIATLPTDLQEGTAEALYYAALHDAELSQRLMDSAALFARDSHGLWQDGRVRNASHSMSRYAYSEYDQERKKEWQRIQVNVKVLKDNRSNRQGDTAGQRTISAGAVQPAWADYADLLRKYTVLTEEVAPNLEEFDTIYYTYGLRLYHNLPLIEPLEYRETHKIRELVIAIDTSGSTMGEKIRSFLSQTYAILNNANCFSDRFELHIVQCDCEIQAVDVITSREEFVRLMSDYEVRGAGGTSFVPVFEYIHEQQRAGQLTALQGLIYLTDGYGRFPERDPGIRTTFALYQTDAQSVQIPPWAEMIELKGL